jgi:hypothetical protein
MENWFEDINQDAEIRTIDVELFLSVGVYTNRNMSDKVG